MRIFQREWTTPSGETQRGRTYWAQYSVAGRRYYHSLGTRDKRAAELIAADHLRRAELRRAGVADPFGAAKDLAIEKHLEDFETTLRARGVVEKYVSAPAAR